jgi:hypothetical protein
MDKLVLKIESIKLKGKEKSINEEATKQSIILPILQELGWSVFDDEEVSPEFTILNQRVDYSLRHNHFNKVFIEVKKINENLESHQEQLLQYSFKEGVKLAILTNGIAWWFYLPLHEGNWEQRKFNSIDIIEQDTQRIIEKLRAFLSKEEVVSGNAVKNAENHYNNRLKGQIIKENIPKAWIKLVEQKDAFLVELIAETTEKLCGYKPDDQSVKDFISTLSNMSVSQVQQVKPKEKIIEVKTPSPTAAKNSPVISPNNVNYTGQSITSFHFLEKYYSVKNWREVLTKAVEVILERSGDKEKILSITGKKRPYFSYNSSLLREPKELKTTGKKLFVETNLNANNIVGILKDVMELYGYDDKDLRLF